ncbi:hypothetical protein [Arthrobacter sp. NEB 688]|uniref:hypothetical protein n=1 Tax=Arthrobacter sp. NEB 688 TaxID=904039 RepID=UPI0015664080|nr:hypothetical protein [Arthrobacter sp. NEB 688]QKE84270.1 hypothetical protein HL663_10195 [Arthrobacter sp. NEB 688]
MGLFDRWRTPAGGTVMVSGATAPLRHPLAPVPDVDSDVELDAAVRAHLERLTAAAETDVDALTQEQFDGALTARLVSRERVHATGLGFQYALPFTEHVEEVLTLDLPTSIVTLPQARVLATRRSLSSLMEIARANLLRRMDDADVERIRLGSARHSVTALVGDSPYTSSFARFLPAMLERWAPGSDLSGGVVFAMPHRHAMVFQTCTSAAEVRDALELVPAHAAEMYADAAGPVTPHAYHWYHREITCLTEELADGRLAVSSTPLLESVLSRGRRRAG